MSETEIQERPFPTTGKPECAFLVGIAEQNGLLVGAGMALEGKKPFIYAIAPFVTLRALEMIRVECGIMDIPVTLVGVGAGFGYEDSGPTHRISCSSLFSSLIAFTQLPQLRTPGKAGSWLSG